MSADRYCETIDSQLGRILKDYLEAAGRGENPTPEDWVSRNPEYADQLREFFANRQQLNDLLREAQCTGSAEPMIASSAAIPALGTVTNVENLLASRLRYFGDYELESEIARGGMGVVYRARQVSLNRPVAVKMILAGELASAEDVARFRAEAEAAANLDHPAIVPIYEIGEREGQNYFSMKYIAGQSLSQQLQGYDSRQQTRTQIEKRVDVISAVARGIHYAHQRGIIHRDLKPANILLDANGAPHITDFGLARRTAQNGQLTQTGAILGTPSYMAPEQSLGTGKCATTAVDIYGLGAILYAALTGRPPLEGANPIETILLVQSAKPAPPSQFATGIDQELETICLKCLEKDPEARYRSAGELADDLDRWLRDEPIQALPPNPARIAWRWLSTNFQTAVCVLLVGVVTGLLVCEPVLNMLAHNLGGYALIYRGSFPSEVAPWMLRALEMYPRWMGLLLLPLVMFAYFTLGWFTDRLVKPQDLAAAMLSGLGVGTVAALTAFLVGIGWQTIIQVAIWPSQPDLELLVAEISHDSTFTNGKGISDRYPADIHGNPVYTRYVMKKALADMQARIPQALGYGFLLSVGLLLMPATLQTVAAHYLRGRGDRWYWQLVHLLELSIPASILLVALGMIWWDTPRIATLAGLLALGTVVTLHSVSRLQVAARRLIMATATAFGVALVYLGRDTLFTNHSGGINPSLAFAGAVGAACAVVWRFRWWERLLLYGLWIAAIFMAAGFMFGANSSASAGMDPGRQILIAVTACGIILGLAWWLVRCQRCALAREAVISSAPPRTDSADRGS